MSRIGSGTMMVRTAGRKGGRKLYRKKGHAYMVRIGRKGGLKAHRRRR